MLKVWLVSFLLYLCTIKIKLIKKKDMKFKKYTQNLRIENNNVYSYNTLVAKRVGHQLMQLGYWGKATQKHVNYAAKELHLELNKTSIG